MGLFADFHNKGLFAKSLKASFMSLLPKVAGAYDINKFKPISLVPRVFVVLFMISPVFSWKFHLDVKLL